MSKKEKSSLNLLGIDIGSSIIKIVEVQNAAVPIIKKWGCFNNPINNYKDKNDKATIRTISKSIKQFCKKNQINIKKTSICMSDSSIICREFNIPEMENDSILENIKFELSEYFSIDTNNYHVGYKIMDTYQINNSKTLSIMASAAPKSLIKKHIDIVKAAGLSVKYVDVAPNANTKLLKRLDTKQEEGNAYCIIDLGYNTSRVSVYDGEKFFVNRDLDVSIKELNNIILEKYDTDIDNVEKILTTTDITKDLNDYYDRFITPIRQVIDYFHSRNYNSYMTNIILTGGYANAWGLLSHLKEQFGSYVIIAENSMFTPLKGITEEIGFLYFNAIGSAIREDE